MLTRFSRMHLAAGAIAIAMMTISCATSPVRPHMRKAGVALALSEKQAKAGDFEGAKATAASIGQGVRTGIELSPPVMGQGGAPIDLNALLAGWENGPYQNLHAALASGQTDATEAAFGALRGQCVNCHAAIGRPEIRLTRPL